MSLEQIGQEIRKARKARGMTQDELAEALSLTKGRISEIENGSINEIGARKLFRITDYLGLSVMFRPAISGYTMEDAEQDLNSPGMK